MSAGIYPVKVEEGISISWDAYEVLANAMEQQDDGTYYIANSKALAEILDGIREDGIGGEDWEEVEDILRREVSKREKEGYGFTFVMGS